MKDLDSLIKNIKNKEFLPIYFFNGEEPYYIDIAVKYLEDNVLSEDEKAFNQYIIYGKDTSYSEIFALARQFPMMGEKQLIIVKEAQDLKMTEKDTEAFLNYIKCPVESTILVFAYKNKFPGTKRKLVEQLRKYMFLSEKIRDYNIPKFIEQELKTAKIQATPNIPNLLAEHLGTDLSRISNEISKLKMLLKPNELLDEALVEKHIGISKDFNVFELQKALGTKDQAKAMKIAYFMGKNPKTNSIVATLSILYSFFTNIIIFHTSQNQPQMELAKEMGINPFFLKDYATAARFYPLKLATRVLSVLREVDLKSKGLGANQTPEEELYKELVYKILNIDKISVKI